MPLREIDARCVATFRGELLSAGVGSHSVVKTLVMLQRVFRDAVEYGEVSFNPFKSVQKPSPGPPQEAHALTPLQVERLADDLELRGYRMAGVLVRLMAYTGLRPQEAFGLRWYAVRERTLLVEVANADGELERLKNRKRSRKRSRTVDLLWPVQEDLRAWRVEQGRPVDGELVLPHAVEVLWRDEHYRTWRRRTYIPSAETSGCPRRPATRAAFLAPRPGPLLALVARDAIVALVAVEPVLPAPVPESTAGRPGSRTARSGCGPDAAARSSKPEPRRSTGAIPRRASRRRCGRRSC